MHFLVFITLASFELLALCMLAKTLYYFSIVDINNLALVSVNDEIHSLFDRVFL